MMSDLAPFVAAVIRDRVVIDLKDENEALRLKNEALELALHKRNPHRSVQIRDSNGKQFWADNELNLGAFAISAGNSLFSVVVHPSDTRRQIHSGLDVESG